MVSLSNHSGLIYDALTLLPPSTLRQAQGERAYVRLTDQYWQDERKGSTLQLRSGQAGRMPEPRQVDGGMMFECNIDGVSFRLKEQRELSFLSKYGKVFCAFDENDSGNISFGLEKNGSKYFIKVAGLPTTNAVRNPGEAVSALRKAIPVYNDLKHPVLTELVEHAPLDDLYLAVFKWVDGECLFDHWNFAKRPMYTHPQSPHNRYKQLSIEKRAKAFETIRSFFKLVVQKGYVAIDFYDGSIMYDFENDITTICDIDYFSRAPHINTMGRMWGSSRFMSPEEHELNANIDEITNVFTLGAISFLVFGDARDHSFEKWNANKELFDVAVKATSPDRNRRYRSIEEFCRAWDDARI